MSDSWKTGEYADPILPIGKAVFKLMSLKEAETNGNPPTPYVNVMARVEDFLQDYDEEDPTVLSPKGQSVFGQIWLPKEGEPAKKTAGKQQRVRALVEALIANGADPVIEEDDNPVAILLRNLNAFKGFSVKAGIGHDGEEGGEYPVKATINFFDVRKA